MNDYQSKVITNEKCAERIQRIRLECSEIARNSLPGQFVNIRISDSCSPLLRRPFSIHRVNTNEGWVEILFEIRGKGTSILSQVQANEILKILGPLGNSFTINNKKIHCIFVGGGLGIAPFLFLCQQLCEKSIAVTGFYGTRTQKQLCCLNDFAALSVPLYISTEDGSEGYKGYITDKLEDYMQNYQDDAEKRVILACGPPAMLRKIQNLSEKWKIETQLSLETIMACGLGMCAGCAVENRNQKQYENKYHLVCQNGPVFDAKEVIVPG